jgi:hypothetical protein
MRAFRKFVSQLLICLNIRKKEISRQTIHHWINEYDKNLETIISFPEASAYCHTIFQNVEKHHQRELTHYSISHTDVLRILEKNIGQKLCEALNRQDNTFFNDLCELTKRSTILCTTLLEKEITDPMSGPSSVRFSKM